MSRQIIPAVRTAFVPDDLVKVLSAVYLSELGTSPAPRTLAILCAQVALETANGVKCMCFNLGNFKAPYMDQGATDWCFFATTEYVSGKPVVIRPPNAGCAFAAFADLTSGATYYLRKMYDRWTVGWRACLAGDPQGFAAGLRAQGYYTAPVDAYTAGVMKWFAYYMGKLDSTDPPVVAPDPSTLADLSLGAFFDAPPIVGPGT